MNDDSYEQAKVFVKEIIDRVSPRPVIALVGNKLDLEQYRQVRVCASVITRLQQEKLNFMRWIMI